MALSEKKKSLNPVELITSFVSLSVSAILESRGIFPSRAYTTKDLGDGVECVELNAGNVKDDVRLCEKIKTVHGWIFQGLKDAIEKRYLKSATLVILDKDGTASVEQYTFRMDYPCSETMSVSIDAVTTSTNDLPGQLREVLTHLAYFAAHQDALPATAKYFTLKVAKTRIAPPTYTPATFVPCAPSDLNNFTTKTESIKIGQVPGTVRLLYKGPPVNFDDTGNTLDTTQGDAVVVTNDDDDDNCPADDDKTRISASSGTLMPPPLPESLVSLSVSEYNNTVHNTHLPSKASNNNNNVKKRPLAPSNLMSSQDSEDWTASSRRYAKSRRFLSF